MPQQATDVDFDDPLLRVLQGLEVLGIAATSLSSGTTEPPTATTNPYQFWADSSSGRTLRQYGDVVAAGSRALWSLESGPVSLMPQLVSTTPFAVLGALQPAANALKTLFFVDSSGGNRVMDLPATTAITNTLLLFLHEVGGNVVSIVRDGSDTIRREFEDGSETQIDLPNQGDLVGLFTTGDGTWRIWTYRFSGATTATTTKTLTPWETFCDVDSVGGVFTLSLPTPAKAPGRAFRVVKTNSDANAVTVDVDGGANINGATTDVLSTTQYTTATYLSDGSQYWKV